MLVLALVLASLLPLSSPCSVNYITVERLSEGSEGYINSVTRILTLATVYTGYERLELLNHGKKAEAIIESPDKIEWRGTQGDSPFSVMDGRSTYGVLGAPGGDLSELALMLHCYEVTLGGRFLEAAEIASVAESVIASEKRGKFFVTMDGNSWKEWAKVTKMKDPLKAATHEEREAAMEHLPNHMEPHMELLLKHFETYKIRRELLVELIRAVLAVRLDAANPASEKIVFLRLMGAPFQERAFVNVEQSDDARCTYQAPLFLPKFEADSLVVYHPKAVYEYRAYLAEQLRIITHNDEAWREKLWAASVELGNEILQASKAALWPGIATYRIHLSKKEFPKNQLQFNSRP